MFASLLDNNLTQISTINLCQVILDNFDCKQKADLSKKEPFIIVFIVAYQLCRFKSFCFLRLS